MRRTLCTAIAALAVLGACGCSPAADLLSERVLATGPNGPETPASVGAPYREVWIPSHGRRLDGYLVRAPASCRHAPAVLVYHGFDETISKWVRAQKLLYDHCVSSLVFDPTGSGGSSHGASLTHLAQDTLSAYAFAEKVFPPPTRLYLLGHSMGDAVMLQAEPGLEPQPAGVVVADGFSSLRDFYAARGVSRWLLAAMPDWWDNERAVGRLKVPVLVVHSDADRVIPLAQAEAVYAAARPPKQLAIVHGFAHNGLRRHASLAWWAPVLSFVGEGR